MICTVDKMVFGGSCLTKIDGKTVFVEGSLPGETVEINIVENKKDYSKAHVVQVLEASKNRMKPFCPVYEKCGGCDLQHAKYEYELELKKDIVLDCLKRNGIHEHIPIEIVTANDTEYRSRYQFSRGGLKGKKSNQVVPLQDCPCAVKEMRAFLQSDESSMLQSHERLQVFASERAYAKVGDSKVVFGFEGQSELTLQLLGKEIHFDARGFFQSNIAMLEKTIPLVVDNLKGTHLLDMYAGVGTLSLFAKEYFETLTLVEHNKKSLNFAKENFSSTESIETCAMTGEDWVKKAKKKSYDALIIDPPRSGIEKKLRAWICSEKIKTIRYLSCDVSTLARDTKAFLDAGYKVEKFYFLDFYPHTSHLECLVYFSHNGGITC